MLNKINKNKKSKLNTKKYIKKIEKKMLTRSPVCGNIDKLA